LIAAVVMLVLLQVLTRAVAFPATAPTRSRVKVAARSATGVATDARLPNAAPCPAAVLPKSYVRAAAAAAIGVVMCVRLTSVVL
jgi:hypothetical protein